MPAIPAIAPRAYDYYWEADQRRRQAQRRALGQPEISPNQEMAETYGIEQARLQYAREALQQARENWLKKKEMEARKPSTGAAWGRAIGSIGGLAASFIPGVGPIIGPAIGMATNMATAGPTTSSTPSDLSYDYGAEVAGVQAPKDSYSTVRETFEPDYDYGNIIDVPEYSMNKITETDVTYPDWFKPDWLQMWGL